MGDRECRGQELPTGQGSWPAQLWVSAPPPPPKAGPVVPEPAGSGFLSLSPTGSQRFFLLKALSPEQPGRPVTVTSCPGNWDSVDPLARCPAGGGRRRRPAERRVPGDPGPRARRPEPPPSRPAFLVGLISPPGGARGQHPARLPRAPPPRSGAPRSPRLRVRGHCCVRPPSPGMQRVPGRGPRNSGGRARRPRPGGPGKAWGAEAGPAGQWTAALCAPQVRAPRGPCRGRLPLFPGCPGGACAPSPPPPPPRLPSGHTLFSQAGKGEQGAGYSRAPDPSRGAPRTQNSSRGSSGGGRRADWAAGPRRPAGMGPALPGARGGQRQRRR